MRKAGELNDIQNFVVTADSGSLRGAAESLRIPTSTVSRSLSRLEKSLDMLLMHRTQRGIVLTDAGKQYLQSCKRALRILRERTDLLDDQRAKPAGVIRVACPITVARSLIAPILSKFTYEYPELRVELDGYFSGWDQQPKDDVDIFFKILEPKDSSRKVRTYPASVRGLFSTRGYLESAGSPKDPADLSSHRCIGWDTWRLSKGRRVVVPDIQFQVTTSDPAVAVRLALDNAGIAILPFWVANDPSVKKQLVPVLSMWELPSIKFCALYPETSRLTPKIRVFLDFVEQYIGTEKDPRLQGSKVQDCFIRPGNRNNP